MMAKIRIKILFAWVILMLPIFKSYATPIDGTKVIDIRDFGASPSAPADSNTRAIQRAIDSASWGSTIIFPESGMEPYKINNKLTITLTSSMSKPRNYSVTLTLDGHIAYMNNFKESDPIELF